MAKAREKLFKKQRESFAFSHNYVNSIRLGHNL